MTLLNRGDVAVVGYDVANDAFSIVIMADMNTADALYISERSVDPATGNFFSPDPNEGTIAWTPPSNISAGAIVTFSETSTNGLFNVYVNGVSAGTAVSQRADGTQTWNHTLAGDQLFIYQGDPGQTNSTTEPNWLFGFNVDPATLATDPEGDWDTGHTVSGFDSYLPEELRTDNYAYAFYDADVAADVDVAGYYSGPTSAATAAQWRARFADATNWTFSSVVNFTPGSNPFSNTPIIVNAANQAPNVAINAGSSLSEGGLDVVANGELTTTDAESGAGSLTYTVTDAVDNGTLWIDADGSGTINGSEAALGVNGSFTQAQINSGLLKYQHNGSETTGDSFTFSVSDGTNTVTGQTFSFTVAPVNDAPTLGNLNGDTRIWSEATGGNTGIDQGSDATLVDPDSANLNGGTITVAITGGSLAEDRLSVGAVGLVNSSGGTITHNGTVIGTVSGGDGATLVITFTSALVTPAMAQDVLRAILYTNTGGDNPTAGVRNLTVTVTDGDGGTSNVAGVAITVTAENDAPSATSLPADVTVTEDTASNLDLSAVTISDPDSASITVTLAAGAGTLAASSGGSVTVGGSGTGTLTLTGSAANIDAFLNTSSNVTYTGASNASGDNATTLSASANDGSGSVNLGTVNIDITAVNDAPTLTGLPADRTATEDAASDLDLSAITLADVDSASITVTLSVGAGTLTAASGGGVSVGGSGTDTLTLTGSPAAITTFLDTLSAVRYTGAANANGNDADTVGITVNDGSGSISFGTVNIDITAVNDQPVLTGLAGAIRTVTEDTASNLDLSAATLIDPDSGNVTLTLTVPAGTLAASSGGGVTVSGSGSDTLQLSGSAADLNAFLDTVSNITYTGAPNSNFAKDGYVTLTINGDDGTGSIGLGLVSINITPVVDAPVAADDAVTVSETATLQGDLFADNGHGVDVNVDTDRRITAVNGQAHDLPALSVITLPSGATLTLMEDGQFDYDPDGVFEHVPLGSSVTDSFTYTLNGGDTATVTVTITGVDNNDRVTGTAVAEVLAGGILNDTLAGLAGGDTLNGGSGIDTVTYGASISAVNVSLSSGYAAGGHAFGDSFISIENLVGSDFNDTLNGDAGTNHIAGGDGDDTLRGREGADTLVGGNGSDTASYSDSTSGVNVSLLTGYVAGGHAAGDSFVSIENLEGSNHNDTLNGDARTNRLTGGSGNDILRGRGGADTLDGGGNSDWANYSDSDAAVSVSLLSGVASGGHATGDVFISIENLEGSVHDDTLSGDDGNNILRGARGADQLDGGDGNDTVTYAGSNARVNVSLQSGYAVGGHAQGDSLIAIENIIGSSYSDILNGDGNGNRLEGHLGNDRLLGYAGADTLEGGDGADTIAGGEGADELTGGAGADVFLFANTAATAHADTITDFTTGLDVIHLSATVYAGLAAGAVVADAVKINGTGLAEEADDRLIYDSATGELHYDSNGALAGGTRALLARLDPGLALTEADFLVI